MERKEENAVQTVFEDGEEENESSTPDMEPGDYESVELGEGWFEMLM